MLIEEPEIGEVGEFWGYGSRQPIVAEGQASEVPELGELWGYGAGEPVAAQPQVPELGYLRELWWNGPGQPVQGITVGMTGADRAGH